MPDVFISYGRQDRERVRPMAQALEKAGLDVWWDPNIPPGSDFRVETGKALKEATAVIVVWSKYSATRHFVIDEASVALERGVLFPVLLDVVDIPLGFRQIQTVDLTNWQGRKSDPALRALIDATAAFIRARKAPGNAADAPSPPASAGKFTITGTGARLRLLWRATLLSLVMAAGAASITAFAYGTSPVFLFVGLSAEYLWIYTSRSAAAAFAIAFVSRNITFWADSVLGGISLRLFSQPFLVVILASLIVTAPLELQRPISAFFFRNYVFDAQFSPDGSRIVTASWDKTTKLWDTETGAEIASLTGHQYWVWSAIFSPNGTSIVTASVDGSAKLWDAATGKQIASLSSHKGWVHYAAFSPDGARVLTTSADNTAKLWDATTGAEIRTFTGHTNDINSAAFSPDGVRFVTASFDGTAKVWNMKTGKEIGTLAGHEGTIYSATFSPDGARVVTASWDETAKLWDAATGSMMSTLLGHEGPVWSANFNSAGDRIVTGSSDGSAKIWDATTGAEIGTLKGHQDNVSSADFSPDGHRILTASDDNTAKLWDAVTGKNSATLVGHQDSISSATFSPNGNRVVTASRDKTAKMWNAANGELLLTLKTSYPTALHAVTKMKLGLPSIFQTVEARKSVPENLMDYIPLLPRGAGLLLATFIAAALIRLPFRLLFAPEKLRWVRSAVLATLTFYLLLIYLTNLPAEAVLVWVVLAFMVTPAVALTRLLLTWEFRGAFAARV